MVTTMKCLSLRQPWAWAVLHGKIIENRRWNTRFRGEFILHAAKGMTRVEYAEARQWILAATEGVLEVPAFDALPRGGIVGSAELVSVVGSGWIWPAVTRGVRRRQCRERLAWGLWTDIDLSWRNARSAGAMSR